MKKNKKLNWAYPVAAVVLLGQGALASPAGTVLLPAAKIDLKAGTATLPLELGQLPNGTKFWFVFTDASTKAAADRLGLGFAPSLKNAATLGSVRQLTEDDYGNYSFDHGTVDFSPVRNIVPGDAPNYFPPKVAMPGSVASSDYNPLAVSNDSDGTVYNAPIVAKGVSLKSLLKSDGSPDYSKVHDKVVAIDTVACTVTLKLTPGLTDGHKVVYLSFDSNVALAATMEAATFAAGDNDFKNSGAELDLYAVVNGATGKNNGDRQGFNSALAGEGSPLNILTLSSGSKSYSPLWDLNLGVWTDAAIASGQRKRLKSEQEALDASQAGFVTSPDGKALGSIGIFVNCPVVQVL